MTWKSPWFWLVVVALVVAAVIAWRTLRKPRSTSISAPQHLPPTQPPPGGGNAFAQDVNAIAGLGKVAESIFSDFQN